MACRNTTSLASLYENEDEIAHRVLGDDAASWPDLAALWEREGLPRRDAMTGKRFWPAVRLWFDRRHGITKQHVPAQPDGVETWPS